MIVSEIEVRKHCALQQLSKKELCPFCVESIVTEIDVSQCVTLPEYSFKTRILSIVHVVAFEIEVHQLPTVSQSLVQGFLQYPFRGYYRGPCE